MQDPANDASDADNLCNNQINGASRRFIGSSQKATLNADGGSSGGFPQGLTLPSLKLVSNKMVASKENIPVASSAIPWPPSTSICEDTLKRHLTTSKKA